MTSSLRSPRPTIFIGYSHKDRRWVDRLLIHLKPIERDMSVEIWDDSRIKPGAKWRGEIEEALNRAGVAILIISADFLASDFVMNEEVPTLLQNAENNGTTIMPLIIAPSLFSQSVLNCFQAINSPENALSKLTLHKRDEILVRLAMSVETILRQIYTKELFKRPLLRIDSELSPRWPSRAGMKPCKIPFCRNPIGRPSSWSCWGPPS